MKTRWWFETRERDLMTLWGPAFVWWLWKEPQSVVVQYQSRKNLLHSGVSSQQFLRASYTAVARLTVAASVLISGSQEGLGTKRR